MTTYIRRTAQLRYDRFIHLVSTGISPTEAYHQLYPHANETTCTSNAAKLVASPRIQQELARLNKLRQDVTMAHQVNSAIAAVEERQQILTELARARLVDFIDATGQPVLTGDIPNARAVREYSQRVTTAPDGSQTVSRRIKLSDPVPAIAEANKMDGSYAPARHLHGHRIRFQVVHTYPSPSGVNPGDDPADRLLSGDEPGNTT